MPILGPYDKPAQTNWEDDKAKEIKEAKRICVVVSELLKDQLLSYLTIWDYLEHDLHAIVHRRDPREELYHWISVVACICEASCSEVKQSHAQISYQNGHVLIIRHCTHSESKKAPR